MFCANEVMPALNLAVVPSGKHLHRKALETVSYDVKAFGSSFYSQSLALSFKDKGKSYSRIASVGTPFSLIILHSLRRCMFGFSKGCLLNWSLST